ncbi:MAG: hypothetical protein ACPL7D_07020 [Candidatus Sumerlaeaceae bacterium]
MTSRSRNIVFVDPEALARIEQQLRALVRKGHLTAVALVDRTGAILSHAGELPLSEEQMGATAAGVFSTISAVMPDSDRREFLVRMLTNQAVFRFIEVDDRLFVCTFCLVAPDDKILDAALKGLVEEARILLGDKTKRTPSTRSLEAINEKLNELFSPCNKQSSSL